MSKTFSAKWSAIFGRFKSFFRSFFTSDSLDKIVMTFCLKSHLFISAATSHPILRWSHHLSRQSEGKGEHFALDVVAEAIAVLMVHTKQETCCFW